MLTLLLALVLDETAIRAADIRAHQEVLASDALEGREAGSEGGHKAATYIAGRLEALGLEPRFQPFGPERMLLEVDGRRVTLGRGLTAHRRSAFGTAGRDVVVVEDGDVGKAVRGGAKGVLVVGDHGPDGPPYPVPVAGLAPELAAAVRKSEKPVRLVVGKGETGIGHKNVWALIPGTTDAREYAVVGAHYDHVGLGHRNGNKPAGSTAGQVHNGADDNASGTSTMLEVAEALAKAKLPMRMLVVFFDDEENGLGGSRAFVADPPLPIADCRAMINADMIGRNETEKVVYGLQKKADGSPVFPRWAAMVSSVEKDLGVRWDSSSFDAFIRRSDHWPFMAAGVPAVFFTGGLHADYHTERDDVEKINFAKEEAVGRAIYRLAAAVARAPEGFR